MRWTERSKSMPFVSQQLICWYHHHWKEKGSTRKDSSVLRLELGGTINVSARRFTTGHGCTTVSSDKEEQRPVPECSRRVSKRLMQTRKRSKHVKTIHKQQRSPDHRNLSQQDPAGHAGPKGMSAQNAKKARERLSQDL